MLLDIVEHVQEAKEHLEHGEWKPWLKANEKTLGFGYRTAARLMSVASKVTPASHLTESGAATTLRQVSHGGAATNHLVVGKRDC